MSTFEKKYFKTINITKLQKISMIPGLGRSPGEGNGNQL